METRGIMVGGGHSNAGFWVPTQALPNQNFWEWENGYLEIKILGIRDPLCPLSKASLCVHSTNVCRAPRGCRAMWQVPGVHERTR